MAAPSAYDHVRPTDSSFPQGVYRVVGTESESVTLLLVGDDDGRRINTGRVVTVNVAEFERFEPAENPDGNRRAAAALVSVPKTVYWSLRAFVQQLGAHPFWALLAFGLLLLGNVGDRFVDLPDPLATVLVAVGAVLLAVAGSGRL